MSRNAYRVLIGILSYCLGLCMAAPATAFAAGGQLELIVVDKETREEIPCRMHLRTKGGKPRLMKTAPSWHDHFVVDGKIILKLPRGHYEFDIERGPEYVNAFGHFEIEDNAEDSKTVELKRGVDMAKGGWWSGEFDATRPANDLQLLMRSEDLHVLPLAASVDKRSPKAGIAAFEKPPTEFDGTRVFDLHTQRDDRDGGTLLFFRLSRPLRLTGPRYAAAGSDLQNLLGLDEDSGAWVDAPNPAAWDLPLWLAADAIDSLGLANSQLCRPPGKGVEPAGKRRDQKRFQGARGAGLWSQFIYYQILNAGLRLPPSAGSGTGVSPNPLGYNRMYVYLGDEFSYDEWWQGLREGKVVVTNGPLIQPNVDGHRPGHVFEGPAGQPMKFEISLNLTTRDKISYLEVIKNGDVERAVRLDEYAELKGRLPALTFDQSGWFLIRAVSDMGETYRFATTAPYYVDIGEKRISRRAAKFFLDWIEERIELLKKSAAKGGEPDLAPFELARIYWKDRLAKANAD